ncbi:MAG: lipid-binding SYLF domain-containing protein [Deltaproteobacteria bacterium]|nr:lipid-binding SYLF domain-containing protein [Deltaproteobacteria bacterium]
MLFASLPMASAETAEEINNTVDAALRDLNRTNATAWELRSIAKAVLVFPRIVKGGFIVGGQYGEGALRKNGKTVGYYNTVAASWGLQAGIQAYGYAMFFLTDADIKYLEKSDGWEIGVGPSVVIIDEGRAKSFTTTTAKDGIYVFIFDQKGLMAGLGLQGAKISRITKPSLK